jgi:NADH-quinone oxidoreductase subunit L
VETVYLIIVLAPLLAAAAAGLFGRELGRAGAHSVTIGGVALSCALSLYVLYGFAFGDAEPYNATLYEWAGSARSGSRWASSWTR